MLVGPKRIGPNEETRVSNDNPAPTGRLMVVATPIGNLGDLSPRALSLLGDADAVYCEDTRHSRTLFSAHGISPRHRLLALHEHNEMGASVDIIERIARGELVVLICDAG